MDIQFINSFKNIFTINNLAQYITESNLDLFYKLTYEMLKVNELMNLTAITNINEIILKHYVDSVTIAESIPYGASVADIGCGAGFPALPLAIIRPDLKITAIDSTTKKLDYINNTAILLGISNISIRGGRAEALAHDKTLRDSFDIVCARAVAKLNILCEWCLPYVKVNGKFVVMKAKTAEIELNEAKNAIKKLEAELLKDTKLYLFSQLNDGNSVENFERHIIEIRKISKTPKTYPRNNAQIAKKPL